VKKLITVLLIIISFAVLSDAYSAVTYKDLTGRWRLMYSNNCGFEFRFDRNYKACCIIYSGSGALVFKGIYALEGKSLRININQMKNEDNPKRIDVWSKFSKATSSYFIFQTEINSRAGTLILKPEKTIIDGNDSNGYFEKELELKRY
jgi:hypothetical protein